MHTSECQLCCCKLVNASRIQLVEQVVGGGSKLASGSYHAGLDCESVL